MTEQKIEVNYYPLNIEVPQDKDEPKTNTPAVPVSDSNIIPSANGTIMNGGTMQSPNFSKGNSGWQIDSAGNLEANNGNFRGDITGASGTFSGTIAGGSLDIGGDDDTSAHIDSGGGLWLGASVTNKASAPARILNTGEATFTNVAVTTSSTIDGKPVSSFSRIDDGATPAAPAGLTASAGVQGVFLKWTANAEPDIDHYDIYRYTADTQASAVVIASVKVNMAWDSGLTAAQPYYYWLKAIDVAGNISNFNASAGVVATPRNVGTTDIQNLAVDSGQLAASAVTLGKIAADAVTATEINVANLAAINADMGAITAGTIVMPDTGYIRGGQTDYNTGTGFFLGYSGAAYKFSVGNPATDYITWDGTVLTVTASKITRVFTAGQDLAAKDAVSIGNGTEAHVQINNADQDASGNATWLGQTFTTTSLAKKLTKIGLLINDNGTDTITVNIYATSAGVPTGDSLGSKAVACTNAGASSSKNFTFDTPITVSASTMYAIVVTGTTVDCKWYYKTTGALADGTGLASADGSSWSTNAYDYCFDTCEVNTTLGQLYKSSAGGGQTEYFANFIGFVQSATDAGDPASIDIAGVSGGFTGLTATSAYYLANTAGTIATSAGAQTKKVGFSVSTTELNIIQS